MWWLITLHKDSWRILMFFQIASIYMIRNVTWYIEIHISTITLFIHLNSFIHVILTLVIAFLHRSYNYKKHRWRHHAITLPGSYKQVLFSTDVTDITDITGCRRSYGHYGRCGRYGRCRSFGHYVLDQNLKQNGLKVVKISTEICFWPQTKILLQ